MLRRYLKFFVRSLPLLCAFAFNAKTGATRTAPVVHWTRSKTPKQFAKTHWSVAIFAHIKDALEHVRYIRGGSNTSALMLQKLPIKNPGNQESKLADACGQIAALPRVCRKTGRFYSRG